MKILKITVLLAGLLSIAQADAHPAGYYNRRDHHCGSDPGDVNRRQRNQRWRIEQGIDTGLLTPREAEKLALQQYQIARLEHRFQRDGWLNRKERRILRSRLDQASRSIDHLKRNDSYRPVYHEDGYYR